MSAQAFLPKEHEKLPTDLPLEIPAHAQSHEEVEDFKQSKSDQKKDSWPEKRFYHQDLPPPEGVKTIISWHAPGRPFRKKGREYFLSVLLLMLLIEIILFLFSEYTLMAVVVSLVFLAFALATVPPQDFHYRISTQGITIEDHFFLWEELYDFYFKKRDGMTVLYVRTRLVAPAELMITLGDMDQEHIKNILLRYIPYREVIALTFLEKSGDWLSQTFPLERQKQNS